MKKFLLVVLALPNMALAGNCDLPKGEIDFLDARLNHFEAIGVGTDLKISFSSQIEPSSDCTTVQVWQTATADGVAVKKPTTQQCDSIQGSDFSPIPGLVSCTTYKVYRSQKDAAGKPLPYAYMDHGALVTRKYVGLMGGLSSSVFLQNADSKYVIGMNQMMLGHQVKNLSAYDPELKAMAGKIYIDNTAKSSDPNALVAAPAAATDPSAAASAAK